jgi:hypothetical protein
MAHPLAPDLGLGNLDAAAIADYAPKTYALIFAAITFPIFDRPEYPFAE